MDANRLLSLWLSASIVNLIACQNMQVRYVMCENVTGDIKNEFNIARDQWRMDRDILELLMDQVADLKLSMNVVARELPLERRAAETYIGRASVLTARGVEECSERVRDLQRVWENRMDYHIRLERRMYKRLKCTTECLLSGQFPKCECWLKKQERMRLPTVVNDARPKSRSELKP